MARGDCDDGHWVWAKIHRDGDHLADVASFSLPETGGIVTQSKSDLFGGYSRSSSSASAVL